MIKRFIIAFILVVLVVGGLVGFNIFRDRAIEQFFANMPVAPLTVSTTTAEAITWTPSVEAIGTVHAAHGVDLTVETTGIVNEVLFSANQSVEKGDVLVRLDDDVQQADLEAGQTQAELDRQALERAQELQSRGVGSGVSVETAQAAASASQAQLAKLQAVLDQKQLVAPFSGVIGIPRAEVGQYISPGAAVATLQDLDTMRADFTVPEQQLDLLEIGQPVRLGLNAADMPFTGSITGIDPKIDPATRLASVRAEITNPEGRLAPGQFVQIRVTLPEEEGVIALPQTAVVTSLYGDYVYKIEAGETAEDASPAETATEDTTPAEGAADDTAPAESATDDTATAEGEEAPALTARQVFVQVGRRSGDLVEITEGVSAGDRIVTAGQNRLSNGAAVTVDNTVNPAGAPTAAQDQSAEK